MGGRVISSQFDFAAPAPVNLAASLGKPGSKIFGMNGKVIKMNTATYQANFTKGGLMVPESRIVADLLLRDVDAEQWRRAIEIDNVLEKRSPVTAATKAGVIRLRLQTMGPGLWELVRDGGRETVTHAVLAATIKYSRLVGDFLDIVVRDLHRRFEHSIRPQHWDQFMDDCRNRQPDMPHWRDTTMEKLRTRVFGMLTEAGYITDSRSRVLKQVYVAPGVVAYLRSADETYVLRCMQATQ